MTDQTDLFFAVLETLGPAIWVVPTVLVIYFRWNQLERRKLELESMRVEHETRLAEYQRLSSRRNSSIENDFAIKSANEIASRLRIIEQAIEKLPTKKSSSEEEIVIPAKRVSSKSAVGSSNDQAVVRDLSHALNTPLSRIETATLRAMSKSGGAPEQSEYLKSMLASVQICKSFLAAYRELNSIATSTDIWAPESLKDIFSSAGEVYMSKSGKSIILEIDLRDKIDGYSNNYIAAVVLPVLENAIESSVEHTKVCLNFEQTSDEVSFAVTNVPEEAPGGEEIYDSGYITKKGHDGTGLASVRRLLSVHRKARIRHEYSDSRSVFKISLPRRSP